MTVLTLQQARLYLEAQRQQLLEERQVEHVRAMRALLARIPAGAVRCPVWEDRK